MNERIEVDAKALRQLLAALNGQPHEIRELMVLRDAPAIVCNDDPITTLTTEFNTWAATPTPLADAAAIAERPVYVFLVPGDVIQATDERYSAEYCKWKPIAPLYVGTTVEASTRPVRRAIPARAALATTDAAAIAPTEGAQTFEQWADDYGFYDTAIDVHQYARNCAKDAWGMATRVALYPAKPGDLVQCEHCQGWSVETDAPTPKPAVDALTTGAVGEVKEKYPNIVWLDIYGRNLSDLVGAKLYFDHPASEPKAEAGAEPSGFPALKFSHDVLGNPVAESALEEALRDEGLDADLIGELDKGAIVRAVMDAASEPKAPAPSVEQPISDEQREAISFALSIIGLSGDPKVRNVHKVLRTLLADRGSEGGV